MGLFDFFRNKASVRVPKLRVSAASRNGYPSGFDPKAQGPHIFDPALKHFGAALRNADPPMERSETRYAFFAARETVLGHAALIASRQPELVLRGSYVLRHWFRDRARVPKDLDYVVQPASCAASSAAAMRLLQTLAEQITATAPDPIEWDAARVSTESIWTYDRVEGRRLMIPYRIVQGDANGLHSQLQLDLVFGEHLQDAPSSISVAEQSLTVTSRLEAVASKLWWLTHDMYPRGVDLFDATLLSRELTNSALADNIARIFDGFDAIQPGWSDWPARKLEAKDRGTHPLRLVLEKLDTMSLDGEWRHFCADYPELATHQPTELLELLRDHLWAKPDK